MRQSLSVLLTFIGFILWSCSGDSDPEPNMVDCTISGPIITLVASSNITDCNIDNGAIEISISGGEGEISVLFNDVAVSGTLFNNLSEGTYLIKATDGNGCEDEIVVELENNSSSIVIDNLSTTFSGCESNAGSITISATGEGTVTYSLDNGVLQSESVFSDLDAGEYELTITDNECSTTTNVKITTGVSYVNEIQAILTTSCNITGCHNGDIGTSRDWTNFDNVQANAEGIKSRTQSGNMPPRNSGLSLTNEEIDLIACWVDDGALEN